MTKRLMIFVCLLTAVSISAQNDTTISRVVTVERDFQPVIQSAGKINQQPTILQPTLQLNPVVYSTYSAPLSVGHNIYPLQVAETKFTPQAPLNGVLEGAIGHRNTHLLFGYQLHKKKNNLHLYANHDAYWGSDAQSKSAIGVDFTHHFNKLDFYANASGNVMHWDYYRTTTNDTYGIVRLDLGNSLIWDANANVGIQSTGRNAFQYQVQTGYSAIGQVWQTEHMVNTHFDALWTNDTHTAGIKAYVKNNFYTEIISSLIIEEPTYYYPHTRHAIRVEPFYAYSYKNFHLHAGVNIDMNIDPFINGETWLSNMSNLGFAPSPNVHLSWHTNNNLLHIYANATGKYGASTIDEERMYNPFTYDLQDTTYIAPYTPIDATIGIKLRPFKTLLIDVYGGYALRLSDYATHVSIYENLDATSTFNFISTTYSIAQQSYAQWKVGGSLHYHYRDIVELNVDGCYNFYTQQLVYDRPNWIINARLDVHIDSKWSVYSENHFAGSRWANTSKGDQQIRPTISLNIGGRYAINRWLSVYAQVNDYLNRKDEIFYGYKSQGLHFLAGVKWKF